MKRWLKFVFITILIITLASIIWIADSLRVVEPPLESVVKIAKQIDGDNFKGITYAYTLERSENSFILTHYYAQTRCKTIVTYYIVNGVVTKAYSEDHYTTKANARRYKSDLIDREIKGNVVKGWIKLDTVNVSADEWYTNLENSLSRYATKLN